MEVVFKLEDLNNLNRTALPSNHANASICIADKKNITFSYRIFPNVSHKGTGFAVVYNLRLPATSSHEDIELFSNLIDKIFSEVAYQVMFIGLSPDTYKKLSTCDKISKIRKGFTYKTTPPSAHTSL